MGLLSRLGITITNGTKHYLKSIWESKEQQHMAQQEKSYKRKRSKQPREKLRMLIQEAKKKRRKHGFYAPGEGFNNCVPVDMTN
jgi:hypothetical protein